MTASSVAVKGLRRRGAGRAGQDDGAALEEAAHLRCVVTQEIMGCEGAAGLGGGGDGIEEGAGGSEGRGHAMLLSDGAKKERRRRGRR